MFGKTQLVAMVVRCQPYYKFLCYYCKSI